jgi:hypothetical protein
LTYSSGAKRLLTTTALMTRNGRTTIDTLSHCEGDGDGDGASINAIAHGGTSNHVIDGQGATFRAPSH